jgi:hypothetical protein
MLDENGQRIRMRENVDDEVLEVVEDTGQLHKEPIHMDRDEQKGEPQYGRMKEVDLLMGTWTETFCRQILQIPQNENAQAIHKDCLLRAPLVLAVRSYYSLKKQAKTKDLLSLVQQGLLRWYIHNSRLGVLLVVERAVVAAPRYLLG